VKTTEHPVFTRDPVDEDYETGRITFAQFLRLRGLQLLSEDVPLLNDTLTAIVRNSLWEADLREYVEQPADVVRAKLLKRYTPRQIDSTRRALGIKAVRRAGGWWWVPHPSWKPPKVDPKGTIMVTIRNRKGGSVGCCPKHDLEPCGYYWRD